MYIQQELPSLLGKRTKDDLDLMPPPKGLSGSTKSDDNLSMDNNTNCKRARNGDDEYTVVEKDQNYIKVGEAGGQVDAHQFFEQSLYFVDTLKPEFCLAKGDGWMEFKEPIEAETITKKVDDSLLNREGGGVWTDEEHALFLEGLRIYGKDWERVQEHVRTRGIFSIRSHAQKYLARLVKILEGSRSLEGLSEEDVQYFYGVLSKRTHRSVIAKKRKEEQIKEKKFFKPKKIFRIEKPLFPRYQISTKPEVPPAEPETQFEQWQEKASQGRSHVSLKFSIKSRATALKASANSTKPSLFKFSFKQSVKDYDNEMSDDNDSSNSQSMRHHFRYSLDPQFPPHIEERLKGQHQEASEAIQRMYDRMVEELLKLGDLPPDETMTVAMQLGDSLLCLSEEGKANSSIFCEAYYFYSNGLQEKLPNFFSQKIKQLYGFMDNFDADKAVHSNYIEEYLFELVSTPEGRARVATIPIKFMFLTFEDARRIREEQEQANSRTVSKAPSSKEFMPIDLALERLPSQSLGRAPILDLQIERSSLKEVVG